MKVLTFKKKGWSYIAIYLTTDELVRLIRGSSFSIYKSDKLRNLSCAKGHPIEILFELEKE